MAWARLQLGDPRGAIEVAERAARLAPLDPNSQFLAGEIAASIGRWESAEDHFRAAVIRSSSAQLRFHAALIESTARAGRADEARFRYEEAVRTFTSARVLDPEARCQAPGDRYLLARMSRIAARLYGDTGDSVRRQAATEQALPLAQPDRRGICATLGRSGQESPEAVTESFWRVYAEGGWPRAEQFLVPELRGAGRHVLGEMWEGENRPRRVSVTWIAALQGDERQARLRYQIEGESPAKGHLAACATGHGRLVGKNWYLSAVPVMEREPCQP
jgi:tetratricopeptide (TPR) repeat protein